MTLNPFRRALALALSLMLAAGVALVAAPAAQAAPSVDATLSSLTVSAGTFDAPFDSNSNVTSQVTVPNSVSSFSFTPTANDPAATIITWNGWASASTPSGTATTPAFLRVGLNIMTAGVTAQDGTTTKQYTMHVTRQAAPPPADVNLNGLTVSEGTLSPTFDSATTAYTVDVPYATTSITVTPGSSAAGNTVEVTNGGQEVGEVIRLGIGDNLALVTVTAPDNTSKQYTVIITRGPAPTADVDLTNIQLSNGTLSPAFNPAVQFYSVTVPYAVRSMQITATASTTGHTMTINNMPIADGVPATVPVIFDDDGNGFAVTLTAANGATKTYIVHVTRDQPSHNADLTSLSLSNTTLSPAFSTIETAYTATVPYLTTSTRVTSTVADATAILRVNGHDTVSGADSAPVLLAVGANTLTVTATAEDGVTTTTRTIVITREAPDLDLSVLTVTGGTLSPAFDADTVAYTLALPYAVSSVDVGAAAVESDWTLEIEGTETEEATVAVPVGPSTITVKVTAAHGESRQYTVAVTRQAPSTDADLSGITLSDGNLSPAFSAATTGYSATVGYLTEQITVGATVGDATAGLTINGHAVTSAVIPLVVGENSITLVTTAQDGTTTKTTTLIVTREAPDLDLSALTVTGGTLSPAFDADTVAYTLALPYAVSSVDVAAAAVESDWTLEIEGTETGTKTVANPVGPSTITVTVTAAHGESRQYTVAVTRQAPSTDADLSGITLSDGTLSPAFSAATTGYTATVEYLTEQITVGATVSDATASLTVNGMAATSVTSAIVPLVVGENSITLVTTAQDGTTTKTTTLVVTRQTAPTPAIVMDLGFKAGDPAANAPFEAIASNLLPGSTATITMHSTPIILATGTVLADGTIALKGRIPANAEAGAHRLVFEGIAMDGTAATATSWFTVLRNGTVGGVSLTGPVAYVDPQPAPVTPVEPETVPAAAGGSVALASTGADSGFGTAIGASLAMLGALLLMLGGAIRRRRSAA